MSLLQQSGREGWENDEGSNDKKKELELFGTSFSHEPAKAQAQILKLKTPPHLMHSWRKLFNTLPSSAESPETSCYPHGGSCLKLLHKLYFSEDAPKIL